MKQETIKKALDELKLNLTMRYGTDVQIYLFGSVARGDFDDESDIDVLVLVPGEVNSSIEEEIYDESFEIGLKYDVVFGVIVYPIEFWNSGRARVMPLYLNIEKESVKL
ncbi:MAG: nucleotidyltransferase domain-containing protein [Candidatus Eremiobacteraeota bacterium]|nr:nucleotidyltransferase domain-containing protein [Candidatus Eremiobacteraeota bacterium]